MGLESNSRIFTVAVQGLLELQVSAPPPPYLATLHHRRPVFPPRPGSTPPYSWTTLQAPPSPSRTAPTSWECCWGCRTHPGGRSTATPGESEDGTGGASHVETQDCFQRRAGTPGESPNLSIPVSMDVLHQIPECFGRSCMLTFVFFMYPLVYVPEWIHLTFM